MEIQWNINVKPMKAKAPSGVSPMGLTGCTLKATKQIRIKPNIVLKHHCRCQIVGELVQ